MTPFGYIFPGGILFGLGFSGQSHNGPFWGPGGRGGGGGQLHDSIRAQGGRRLCSKAPLRTWAWREADGALCRQVASCLLRLGSLVTGKKNTKRENCLKAPWPNFGVYPEKVFGIWSIFSQPGNVLHFFRRPQLRRRLPNTKPLSPLSATPLIGSPFKDLRRAPRKVAPFDGCVCKMAGGAKIGGERGGRGTLWFPFTTTPKRIPSTKKQTTPCPQAQHTPGAAFGRHLPAVARKAPKQGRWRPRKWRGVPAVRAPLKIMLTPDQSTRSF